MPFNRRTISFQLRKTKDGDEDAKTKLQKAKESVKKKDVRYDVDNEYYDNSDNSKFGVLLRPRHNSDASNLSWKKSVSAEVIHELKNSRIFKQQQVKIDKRLSKSYTNFQSNEHLQVSFELERPCSSTLSTARYEKEIAGKHGEAAGAGACSADFKFEKRKSTSLTNLLTPNTKKSIEELLKSFNQLSNQKSAKFDNRFPLDENDEDQVQIRKNDSIKRDIRRDHSKTTDGTIGRLRNHNRHKKFDIRGLTKIQLPHERSPIKLSHEYVMYENDGFYKVNEVGNMKALLRRNVILKSARPLNSKNVELKDCNDLSYILYFDSSKDAKIFIENEKIQGYVNNDNKTTITKTLLKLLGKRSSREILERKGIYKNEPIFGNTLRDIYTKGGNEVPPFIYKVIELIERPENITSLGLYRTSGNLATIQKIRFEVDNGRLGILDEFSKDVDVLTGSLKLFFRELKEPLITCEICDEILGSIKLEPKLFSKKDKEKLRSILCKNLHDANLETLFVLIRHLLEVVKFKEENKMDPYNLAVCWGPSSIFSVNQELSRDIVTQSQDATRLIEFLLNFYKEHPEELYYFGGKKLDYCPLIRQGSKDSIGSYESSSKNSKKSSSTASLSVDEIIRKPIEIIELNINSEGLYKKSGSVEKTNKIMKKLTKKKIHELDKHKNDVYDVTDALKKYLRESQDAFVTKDTVDRVIAVAESFQNSTLDLKAAQTIVKNVEETTKKDTFIFILKHIIKVVENHNFHKVSKTDIINIWTNILNYQKKVHPVNEVFSKFLTILLDVFDDNKKFEKSDVVTQKNNAALNNVLKDLKFQQEKDRYSRYDNVSDNECRGEACFLDRKTENTKL